MTFAELLSEAEARIYQGFIRVTYTDQLTVSILSDLIRSIEGVTIVTSSQKNEAANVVTFKVKIRSLQTGEEAFKGVRKKTLANQGVVKFEIGTNTIQRIE